MASTGATWERNDVPLAELTVTVVQTNDRFAAQNDDQLLASVVVVVDELRATWLELPDRTSQRSPFGSDKTSCADAAPVGNLCPDILRICHATSG